jgi:hypothetical protein
MYFLHVFASLLRHNNTYSHLRSGLLPTLLVGPALGVAATYVIRKDGLGAVRDRLFGVDPKKNNQFQKG